MSTTLVCTWEVRGEKGYAGSLKCWGYLAEWVKRLPVRASKRLRDFIKQEWSDDLAGLEQELLSAAVKCELHFADTVLAAQEDDLLFFDGPERFSEAVQAAAFDLLYILLVREPAVTTNLRVAEELDIDGDASGQAEDHEAEDDDGDPEPPSIVLRGIEHVKPRYKRLDRRQQQRESILVSLHTLLRLDYLFEAEAIRLLAYLDVLRQFPGEEYRPTSAPARAKRRGKR